MTAFVLGLGIGLVIGWNLLPQPEFARKAYEWAVSRFK